MTEVHEEIYGPHLLLRIGEIEFPEMGRDAGKVAEFLVDLVGSLGMRVLAGPCVGYEAGDAAHIGHSGVVILYESHAAIHTYPAMRQAFLDIFSCKPFPTEAVYEVLRRWFGNYAVLEETRLDRGVHWQNDARAALAQWQGGRAN